VVDAAFVVPAGSGHRQMVPVRRLKKLAEVRARNEPTNQATTNACCIRREQKSGIRGQSSEVTGEQLLSNRTAEAQDKESALRGRADRFSSKGPS
jgi:hypothetical protein